MLFADKISFDHPRKTADGYMVVRARAARAGIYDYLGKEIDPEGSHFRADQVVKVYRPESEVFAQDSVASFLMKPVTNNHPASPVTADNWVEHAKGVVGKALRDGEYLAFDIVLMDKKTIADVEAGKRELSNGYGSEIDIEDGEFDGQPYDAVQRNIRGNHVAVVDKGRAGPMCRIGDAVQCDALPADELLKILTDGRTYNGDLGADINGDDGTPRGSPNPSDRGAPVQDGEVQVATKTITFDGLPVEVTDAAEAVIRKLEGQVADAKVRAEKAEGEVATLTTDKSTLEAKVTTLEKTVEDAKLTPAQLRDAGKAYAATVETAKKLAPDLAISDDADELAIRKAVVTAKLGDAAKDWTDDQIATSFATMSAQVGDAPLDPVRNVLSGGLKVTTDAKADYEDSREKRKAAMRDAYRKSFTAAADA